MSMRHCETKIRGQYEICKPDKSVKAAALYEDLRYETFPECVKPCTEMKVSTHYKFKFQNQEKQSVIIIFPTEAELSVETVRKSLFSTSITNIVKRCET